MYASRSRTNRAITATHWNGASWSNGKPNSMKDAYIDADYTTASGSFSCRDLIITTTAMLTIITDSYIKVLRNLNQSPISKMIIKDKANLMFLNKYAATESAKVQVEAIFPNHQLLDYEFISSPISGIPLKSISPGTLDNRFYTYDEANNTYLAKNPNTTLTSSGAGYMIRVPNNFSTIVSDWSISFNNYNNGYLNTGIQICTITKNLGGFNLIGNPYPSKICRKLFGKANGNFINPALYLWNKTNGAQGSSYYWFNTYTDNIGSNINYILINKGFIVIKNNTLPPNEITFTPDMMITSEDFSAPDRLYINIKQNGVNLPIGGFCYDVKKFPIPFEDVTNSGVITIIDNEYKIICRKDTFNLTDILALRVSFEVAATYTITLSSISGFFEELEHIYLVDLTTGTSQNLKSSPYIFTSPAGEFLNRFQIKFED